MRIVTSMLIPLVVVIAVCGPGRSHAQTLLVANKSDDTVDLLDLGKGQSVATLPMSNLMR